MSLTQRAFPRIALLEGTTLILLMGIAVPLKRIAGFPEMVSVVGPIHGLCFLLYVVGCLNAAARGMISHRLLPIALTAAVIPGGTWLLWRLRLRRKAEAFTDKKGP